MGLTDLFSPYGSRALLLAGAAAVLLANPTSSVAQKTDPLEAEGQRVRDVLRQIANLNRILRDVEAARLRGDCDSVNEAYFHFKLGEILEGLPEDAVADFKRRMLELAAQPCPPGSSRPFIPLPPPPAPLVTAPAPTGSAGTPAIEPRQAPPPPPRSQPEEIHVPPKPVAPPQTYEPSNPTPDPVSGDNLSYGGQAIMTREREEDEMRALGALEALRLKGDCAAYLAERERLRGLLEVLPLPPEGPCPPVTAPVTQSPPVIQAPKPKAASLRDQALTANLRHAQAADPCDLAAMARYLQELDRLVQEAEMEMMSWDSPLYHGIWLEKSRDYDEIVKIRDAARRRQADCPKDRRVGLNPQEQTFLALHNQARSEFGAPPLQWDPELATSARIYALQLTAAGQLVHSSRVGRKDVRENLLQNLPGGRTPTQMIGMWTDEKRFFKPGIFPDVSTTGNWADTGHLTQVIWPTTTHVGCATAGDSRFEWLVCHYRPGGNKDGKPVGLPPMPQLRGVTAATPVP
jgi:hypothetical protein